MPPPDYKPEEDKDAEENDSQEQKAVEPTGKRSQASLNQKDSQKSLGAAPAN